MTNDTTLLLLSIDQAFTHVRILVIKSYYLYFIIQTFLPITKGVQNNLFDFSLDDAVEWTTENKINPYEIKGNKRK